MQQCEEREPHARASDCPYFSTTAFLIGRPLPFNVGHGKRDKRRRYAPLCTARHYAPRLELSALILLFSFLTRAPLPEPTTLIVHRLACQQHLLDHLPLDPQPRPTSQRFGLHA